MIGFFMPGTEDPATSFVARWGELIVNDHYLVVSVAQLLLALVLLAALHPRVRQRWRLTMFGFCAVAGLAAYFNFFRFHFGVAAHDGDTFHYYIGSKYFAELGYDGLYHATVLADRVDDPYFDPNLQVNDLGNYYRFRSRAELVQDGGRILERFSAVRWNEFRSDVAAWRNLYSSQWEKLHIFWDHGYNGSPLVTAMLRTVIDVVDLPAAQFKNVAAYFDVALILAAAVWLAHGVNTGAALCFIALWAINPLNDYQYIGGSLLRYVWFVALMIAVVAFQRGKLRMSAAAFAVTGLMRLFPLAWVAALATYHVWRWRGLTMKRRTELRTFYGTFVGAVVAIMLATAPVQMRRFGDGWQAFADKIMRHGANVSLNVVGLPVLSFVEIPRTKKDCGHTPVGTPCLVEIERRQELRAAHTWGRIAALGALIIGCGYFLRRARDETEAFFVGWLLCFAVALSHYDYMILSLLPVVFWRREGVTAVVTIGMAALAGLCLLPLWWGQFYAYVTLLVFALYGGIAWHLLRGKTRHGTASPRV